MVYYLYLICLKSLVVQHLLVLQQLRFQVLVFFVLVVDRRYVPGVTDLTVVCRLELTLECLYLLPQLPPLRLYVLDVRLDHLGGQLVSPLLLYELLQFLVVDVEGAEGLLLAVVRLSVEEFEEIVVVVPQFVLHFLLFVLQILRGDAIDEFLQVLPIFQNFFS